MCSTVDTEIKTDLWQVTKDWAPQDYKHRLQSQKKHSKTFQWFWLTQRMWTIYPHEMPITFWPPCWAAWMKPDPCIAAILLSQLSRNNFPHPNPPSNSRLSNQFKAGSLPAIWLGNVFCFFLPLWLTLLNPTAHTPSSFVGTAVICTDHL